MASLHRSGHGALLITWGPLGATCFNSGSLFIKYENKDVTRHGNQFATPTSSGCNPGGVLPQVWKWGHMRLASLSLSCFSISTSATWGVNGVGPRSTNGVMYGHKQEHSEKTDPPDSLKAVWKMAALMNMLIPVYYEQQKKSSLINQQQWPLLMTH